MPNNVSVTFTNPVFITSLVQDQNFNSEFGYLKPEVNNLTLKFTDNTVGNSGVASENIIMEQIATFLLNTPKSLFTGEIVYGTIEENNPKKSLWIGEIQIISSTDIS